MQTLLFYAPAGEPPVPTEDLGTILAGFPEVELGAPTPGYRPARWRDHDTGASCQIDLGEPQLEGEEDVDPPAVYTGWQPLPLAVHVPLAGPHWFAVEALRFVEALLGRLPGARALDTEDTRFDDAADPGPFPWNRLRALAGWEQQQRAQEEGHTDLVRMERHASLALWRYRRERRRGLAAHAGLAWPEALALRDGNVARSAALWLDPSRPLALPPVELVVVRRAEGAGVIPADEVATAAGGGQPLVEGGARALAPSPRLADLHARALLLPASRFTALADGDWVD